MEMLNMIDCKKVIWDEMQASLTTTTEIKDYFVNSTYSLILLLFLKNITIFFILFLKLNKSFVRT